mmetsp:Transcript_68867/g.107835  ORF Transcript_68867/g.107835 Transcript_68867/m.107835 type:complete len:86 (+) Transcript_68867:2144-2401(+)
MQKPRAALASRQQRSRYNSMPLSLPTQAPLKLMPRFLHWNQNLEDAFSDMSARDWRSQREWEQPDEQAKTRWVRNLRKSEEKALT